jgi:CheY-like chemotaxis protein
MSPEARLRAVEPFFTTKGPGRGTGLGLSQVFGFITQSGGTLEIESEIGRGTRITLTLPKAAREFHPETAVLAPTKAPSEEGAVLVVEDDDSVAAVVCEMIVNLGYRTVRVGTAGEALEALEQGQSTFDIIFSDIMMPGTMNGIDLARAVRQRIPGLPIVLTTGYAGLAASVDTEFSVLHKPYGPEQLRQTLAKARRPVLHWAVSMRHPVGNAGRTRPRLAPFTHQALKQARTERQQAGYSYWSLRDANTVLLEPGTIIVRCLGTPRSHGSMSLICWNSAMRAKVVACAKCIEFGNKRSVSLKRVATVRTMNHAQSSCFHPGLL